MKKTLIAATIAAIVSGCIGVPRQNYEAGEMMRQQREAAEVIMNECRAGNMQACAFVSGMGVRQ